jgi:hypothetical protein
VRTQILHTKKPKAVPAHAIRFVAPFGRVDPVNREHAAARHAHC